MGQASMRKWERRAVDANCPLWRGRPLAEVRRLAPQSIRAQALRMRLRERRLRRFAADWTRVVRGEAPEEILEGRRTEAVASKRFTAVAVIPASDLVNRG